MYVEKIIYYKLDLQRKHDGGLAIHITTDPTISEQARVASPINPTMYATFSGYSELFLRAGFRLQPRENPLLVLLESESPLLMRAMSIVRRRMFPMLLPSGGSSSGVLFAGSGDLSMHACIVCLCGCIFRC